MASNMIRPLLEHGLTSGAKAGAALVGLSALLYATGHKELVTTGFGHFLILWYAIMRCQQRWENGGGFGTLLLAGCICGLSASLFVDLYSAFYAKVLCPDFEDETISQTMEAMRSLNIYSPEELRKSEAISRRLFIFSMSLGTSTLYGVLSLIFGSAFAYFINKKKKIDS